MFATRLVTPRRAIAAALLLLAAYLWFTPREGSTEPMIVAARPIAPGTQLSPSDVRVVRAPPDLVPESALVDQLAVSGRILTAGAAAGEPITESRLVGPATISAGESAVAVRLSDPGIAELVRPGSRVDVVSVNRRDGGAVVLAKDATVVTVRDQPRVNSKSQGSLLLIALPRDSATQVASISLERPVTVTLR